MPLFSPSLHFSPAIPTAEHTSSKVDRAAAAYDSRVVVYNSSTGEVCSSHVGMVPYQSCWIFPLHGYTTDSYQFAGNNLSNSTTTPKVVFTVPFNIKVIRAYSYVSAVTTDAGTQVDLTMDVTRNGTSIFSNTATITGNLAIAGRSGGNRRIGTSSSVTPGSGISSSHAAWSKGDVIRIFQVQGFRVGNINNQTDRHHAAKFVLVYYRVP